MPAAIEGGGGNSRGERLKRRGVFIVFIIELF